MKCPICNKGNLEFKQDAMITYSLLDNGEINKELEITNLDNSSIECNHCYKCSDSNIILMKIYRNTEYDTSMSEAL